MSLLLVFCLADAFWPYFRDANFKGDLAPTPPLHGAYKVVSFVKNGDTIAPDLRETKRWKMAFVHRQGYFIVQYMDESMEDYEMAFEHQTELLLSQNHHASGALKVETTILNSAPVLGKLSGMIGKDSIIVNLEYVDWKQLPAVQPDFHWTSDQ